MSANDSHAAITRPIAVGSATAYTPVLTDQPRTRRGSGLRNSGRGARVAVQQAVVTDAQELLDLQLDVG